MTTTNQINADIERLRAHLECETEETMTPAQRKPIPFFSPDANKELDPAVARLVRLRDMRRQIQDLKTIRTLKRAELQQLDDEIVAMQLQFDREAANEAGY